jgi:hypothetical protein
MGRLESQMGQDLVSKMAVTSLVFGLWSKIAVQKVLSRKVYCDDAKSTSLANYLVLFIKLTAINIPNLEATYNACMITCCGKIIYFNSIGK